MPLVHIVLAFTFQAVFQGILRMFILMATSSLSLNRLFCFCMCLSLLCYILVLSLLLLSLVSFWGCLWLISYVFDCFIRSFKSSKTRLNRLFTYPLTKLFKIWWMGQHDSFLYVATLVFMLYSRRSFKSTKGLCPPYEVYGMQLVFSSKKVLSCFTCPLFPPSLDNFSTIHLRWCLTLGRAREYNRAAIVF